MVLKPCICDSHVLFLTKLQKTISCLIPYSESNYVLKFAFPYFGIEVPHNYVDIMLFSQLD